MIVRVKWRLFGRIPVAILLVRTRGAEHDEAYASSDGIAHASTHACTHARADLPDRDGGLHVRGRASRARAREGPRELLPSGDFCVYCSGKLFVCF